MDNLDCPIYPARIFYACNIIAFLGTLGKVVLHFASFIPWDYSWWWIGIPLLIGNIGGVLLWILRQ